MGMEGGAPEYPETLVDRYHNGKLQGADWNGLVIQIWPLSPVKPLASVGVRTSSGFISVLVIFTKRVSGKP